MPVTLTQSDLDQFIGSEEFFRHQLGMVYTQGVHFLAEQAGAFWLIDAIASHQPSLRRNSRLKDFQLWTLTVNAAENSAVLTCQEDSDLPAVVTQDIEFTDFPMPEIKLYVCGRTIMLRSEY